MAPARRNRSIPARSSELAGPKPNLALGELIVRGEEGTPLPMELQEGIRGALESLSDSIVASIFDANTVSQLEARLRSDDPGFHRPSPDVIGALSAVKVLLMRRNSVRSKYEELKGLTKRPAGMPRASWKNHQSNTADLEKQLEALTRDMKETCTAAKPIFKSWLSDIEAVCGNSSTRELELLPAQSVSGGAEVALARTVHDATNDRPSTTYGVAVENEPKDLIGPAEQQEEQLDPNHDKLAITGQPAKQAELRNALAVSEIKLQHAQEMEELKESLASATDIVTLQRQEIAQLKTAQDKAKLDTEWVRRDNGRLLREAAEHERLAAADKQGISALNSRMRGAWKEREDYRQQAKEKDEQVVGLRDEVEDLRRKLQDLENDGNMTRRALPSAPHTDASAAHSLAAPRLKYSETDIMAQENAAMEKAIMKLHGELTQIEGRTLDTKERIRVLREKNEEWERAHGSDEKREKKPAGELSQ